MSCLWQQKGWTWQHHRKPLRPRGLGRARLCVARVPPVLSMAGVPSAICPKPDNPTLSRATAGGQADTPAWTVGSTCSFFQLLMPPPAPSQQFRDPQRFRSWGFLPLQPSPLTQVISGNFNESVSSPFPHSGTETAEFELGLAAAKRPPPTSVGSGCPLSLLLQTQGPGAARCLFSSQSPAAEPQRRSHVGPRLSPAHWLCQPSGLSVRGRTGHVRTQSDCRHCGPAKERFDIPPLNSTHPT